ncbi:glycosyltransferase family 2 protein [Clostridium cibarium]|uniref:Glycosyltransferase family 2 protein n=1 Tax=Clostridium cibarium TaxID=2762247 RepID=A0ABR8PYV1_9CLOT|nr:glycosyltransferase family 2 protein [Clostridium cibarium]MBD7913312.1 glycosyltransferase family 2 protein [Clostridium cibarium]
MNELISIIIPVYKVEEYLRRCINSVLKQTYKNLEVILVDDGSPDRSGEICDEFAALDNRIKVIHKKNGGLSDARNAGIDICEGEYIAFIDSDDWVHDKYIENLYKLLKKTNSDISVCNFIKTAKDKVDIYISNEEIYEYTKIEALEQFVDKFYVQMVIACGKLYKRNLFREIRFPVGRLHEDEFITYKVIFKAKKIVLTTAQLYYYWQREDSIMGSGFSLKGRLDALDAFEERGNFFDSIKEMELRDKTFRIVFNIYKTINDKINLFEKNEEKMDFKKKFMNFKRVLRKTKQSFFLEFITKCII